ncbi:MAG: IPT/TIG domain-containing protein, partial [Sphaerospermopsis kisseleviana]
AIVTLVAGTGYLITPDASSFAIATLRDAPSLPVQWNFNTSTTTNKVIFANQGVGQVSLSNWSGTTASFSGVTNNSLALVGRAGNNSWIDFNFSTIGYRNLTLGFWTRGTSSGFTNGSWSFSTNGLAFTTLTGVNTATTSTTFSYRSIDFSAFSLLNNAAAVTMRYTLSGATSDSGNNRLDELTFGATRMAIGDELREVSVVAAVPAALESPLTTAVFSVRLNGLATTGGLTVAFQLSGTATTADYTVTGAQSWDPVTRSGTVFFPENEDTVFVGIQPVDDGVAESSETVILTLPVPAIETYLLGADTTASVTIRDRRSNDNFADAYLLEGLQVTTVADNIGATKETGEPSHFSSTGTRSVWWRWTAPASGTLTVDTVGSSFDTILAVYTGNAVNALTRLASDDDSGGSLTSRVSLNVAAGTTYMIAVDGFSSATGTINLALSALTSPAVSSFSPSSGAPGAQVTINGFNFNGASAVAFGGANALFSIVGDGQILATVPTNAVSGVITVTSSAGVGQSSAWFSVARAPSAPSVAADRSNIGGLSAVAGSPSAAALLSISGTSLPGTMRVTAPAGFEVSLDGQTFADVIEISAPERSDNSTNYSAGWTNGANFGYGFNPWSISVWQGASGAAGAVLANPEDSGIAGFGVQAFSAFATPAASQAYSSVRRGFASAMSVGESMSFRWAVNWDPNTSAGANYFYVYSGGALLFSVRHGNNPGQIFFSPSGAASIDTGIAYGDRPMTWKMTLVDARTLRVSATGRDGGSQFVFTRDIVVPGAPDAVLWYAYQVDSDIRRRAYFNDLRIDSASPGGGHLPSQTVYVRLASNAPAGPVSGSIDISSGGQSLSSVGVNGTVGGTTGAYDAWAQSHELDPQGSGARGADADGDGHSNLREFLFGSSPKQPTDSLWRHDMQLSGLVLTFVARETGVSYKLMSTTDLLAGPWVEQSLEMAEPTDQDGVPEGHKRRQVLVSNPVGTRFFLLQAAESSP